MNEPKCKVCGCTDANGCVGGCIWVAPDLCSRCGIDLLNTAGMNAAPLMQAVNIWRSDGYTAGDDATMVPIMVPLCLASLATDCLVGWAAMFQNNALACPTPLLGQFNSIGQQTMQVVGYWEDLADKAAVTSIRGMALQMKHAMTAQGELFEDDDETPTLWQPGDPT